MTGEVAAALARWRVLAAVLGCAAGVGVLPVSSTSAVADATATVTFSIDASAGRSAISPLIYGTNADSDSYGSDYSADVAAADPTIVRVGGNRWTTYNWENNASNAGADYCFENDDYLDSSATPGAAVQGTIDDDDSAGIDTLISIPIQGYVSADTDSSAPDPSTNADTGCPQDVRNSPSYLTTRFDPEAPEDPSGPTATPAHTAPGDTVYEDDFAKWLSVHEPDWTPIFDLDNEPDYWTGTHPEVVTSTATYAQVLDDDISYAKAIKQVYPDAEIAGPVLGGYYGLLTLDEPDQYQSTDYQDNGDFTDYYLKGVAAANHNAGTTLISDFDLHWYPQDPSVPTDGTTAQDDAYREQWPRSLWDPTYTEESSSYLSGFGPIDLIPSLESKIAADDPGMNLNIDEWDFGGGSDISGAIATADTLGAFGKYGVHLATYWPQLANESYAFAAFKLFRDYDGAGNGFGDTEVQATDSDPDSTSVYASIDAAGPSHMVIVAINKKTVPDTATIDIAHEPQLTAAKVYTLTAAGGPEPVASSTPLAPTDAGDSYSYEMPAQSVSVIVPALAPDHPVLYADTPPATAVVGQSYSYTFGATGTPAPTYAVTGGSLPPGLTLDPSSGLLSGTPSAAGDYTFTLQAANGTAPDASASVTIDVGTPAAPILSADTPPALTDLVTPYSYTFAATGTPAPTFSLAGGALPPGLALDATTGTLSGTATAAGTYRFAVEASNGASPAATSPTLTIKVTAPLPGDVFAWGTTNGQSDLGTAAGANPLVPEPVAFPAAAGKFVQVAEGDNHSLAVTAGGRVYAWGDNSDGELGDGTQDNADAPVLVRFPGNPSPDIVAVAAGYEDSVALDSAGDVWTWGDDALGELGNGADNSFTTAPAKVNLSSVGGSDDTSAITAVAAGAADDYALTDTGDVIAWGDGNNGGLGDGTTTNSETPVPVLLGSNAGKVTAIAATGTDRALALTTAGTVIDWGTDDDGELGNGTSGSSHDSDVPVTVLNPSGSGALTGVTAIGAGDYDSYAAQGSDGDGLAWGADGTDQLGNASTSASSLPVAISEPSGGAAAMAPLVGFAGGFYTSFALADDGLLYGFGEDWQGGYGLVGDGQNNTTDPVPTPVSFPDGTFISQVAGSDDTTLALTGGAEPTVPPANTTPPTITGTAQAGDTVTCTPGTWSGDTPQTYRYEWLVDGSATGALSSTATLTLPSADAGDELSCIVEASNDATTNQAESAAVQIAPAPAGGSGSDGTTTPTGTTTAAGSTGATTTGQSDATVTTTSTVSTPIQTVTVTPAVSTGHPAGAKLKLASTAAISKRGLAELTVSCRGSGACTGTLVLGVVTGQGRHATTVTLGLLRYRIAAGARRTLSVRLSAKAVKLLDAARHHTLVVTVSGLGGPTRRITLKLK